MDTMLEILVTAALLACGLLLRLYSFRAKAHPGNPDGRTVGEGSIVRVQLLHEPAARAGSFFIPLPKVHVTVITFADGSTVRLLGDQRRRCYLGQPVRIRRRLLGGYHFIDLAP